MALVEQQIIFDYKYIIWQPILLRELVYVCYSVHITGLGDFKFSWRYDSYDLDCNGQCLEGLGATGVTLLVVVVLLLLSFPEAFRTTGV